MIRHRTCGGDHLGIQVFATPSDISRQRSSFYDWMRVGHEAFLAAMRAGYTTYKGGHSVRGTAIEVFPHATAVALRGHLPPKEACVKKSVKRQWREAALESAGVATTSLRSLDAIDAALAALTGLFALDGRFTALGTASDGMILLPTCCLPCRYQREL